MNKEEELKYWELDYDCWWLRMAITRLGILNINGLLFWMLK